MLYSVSPGYVEQFPVLDQFDISLVADDNPYKEEIKARNPYATYPYQFAMSLQMVQKIIDKTVKDTHTRAKIGKALHTLYAATQGFQAAFLDKVEDMQK